MKTQNMMRLAAASFLATLLGCGGNTGGAGDSVTTGDPETDTLLVEVADVEVPTKDEAAAQAEVEITEDNADAEFERLKAELDAEDG